MSTARLVLAVSVLLGASMPAAAAVPPINEGSHTKCPPGHIRVLEQKQCKSGVIRQRACCTNPNKNKTRCKSFPHCPHPTRS